jgi:predicted DNA-binding transcriptional regulator AlpA
VKKKARAATKAGTRLLSRKDVLSRVPIGYSTIWKMMQAGNFPRSRQVGGKAGWIEAEIDAWAAALPVVKLKGDRGS